MKIKPIAAQLRQQHWGFTTAGFVLEPGTMLNSMSPILRLCTLRALINQKCNHVTEKGFLWPPQALSLIVVPQRSSNDNYDIKSWNLPESTTCPRGPQGEQGARGVLSVPDRSRQSGLIASLVVSVGRQTSHLPHHH